MELFQQHRKHPEVCDAISGSRPKVRREVLGVYIKRVGNKENIALYSWGVKKYYEIDEKADTLSFDISNKIEQL